MSTNGIYFSSRPSKIYEKYTYIFIHLLPTIIYYKYQAQ